MTYDFGAFNNWGSLKKVAVRKPIDAFVSDAKIDAEWKDLNFHSRPDFTSQPTKPNFADCCGV